MAKPWQVKVYTLCKVDLCENIAIEDEKILLKLQSVGLITKAESELVKAKLQHTGPEAANNKLLDIIRTRTTGYDELMKILKDLGQSGPYNILQQGKLENEPQREIFQQPQPPHAERLSTSVASGSSVVSLKRKSYPEDEVDDLQPVIVKRPAKVMNFEDDHYHLPPKAKGLALIINIIKSRESAKTDTERLMSMLSQGGYELYNKGNILEKGEWTAAEIREVIKEFRDRAILLGALSTFVFVGGHGRHGKILASNGNVLIWKDILNEFNTHNCEKLLTKPKIFMIQACQTFEKDDHDDEDDESYPPNFDNYALIKATIPGFPAKRNKSKGSVMVYYFTEVFMETAHSMSFQQMIPLVQDKVQKYEYSTNEKYENGGKFKGGQTIRVEHSTLKTLYFNLEPNNQ